MFDYTTNTSYFDYKFNNISLDIMPFICALQYHHKVAIDKCQLDIGFVLFYKQYITGNVILGYFSKTSIFQKHRNYKEGPSYNPL